MLETRALKVAYIFDTRGLVAYELVAYEKKQCMSCDTDLNMNELSIILGFQDCRKKNT